MQRPEGRIREYTRPAANTSPAAIYPKSYLKSLFLLDQMMALHEVAAKTRQTLTAQVHQIAVSRNQMQSEDLKVILGALIQQQCTVAASATSPEAGTQAMALIGPTGKGKTTTLAKLAAVEARQYNRRVGLISLDNYRIGGIAQLRIFARIIGVPLLVARDRGEFRAALQRLRSLDKILIDTPGFNPRDRQQIDQLARLLAVAQPLDVHLVCSATTKVADMHQSLRQLEQMALSHMIFTKLDESMTHGTVLTHMMQGQLPVSFFTIGPQVPEDIQRASAQAILNRIINPQTERHVWSAAPETLADQREAFEQTLMAQQPPLAPYRSFSQATPQPQKAARPARQGQSIMV
jgi:flagellar biosynthesis GTPase FlhF